MPLVLNRSLNMPARRARQPQRRCTDVQWNVIRYSEQYERPRVTDVELAQRVNLSPETVAYWRHRAKPPTATKWKAPPTRAVPKRREKRLLELANIKKVHRRERTTDVRHSTTVRVTVTRPYNTAARLAAEYRRRWPSDPIKAHTVRRALRAAGWRAKRVRRRAPALSSDQLATRVRLAKEYIRRPMPDLFFDTSYFNNDEAAERIEWCPADEQPSRHVTQGGDTAHVWAFIGRGKLRYGVFPKKVGRGVGRHVLIDHVLEPNKAWLRGKTIVFDGAGSHRHADTLKWFRKNHVTVYDWPARSPDLNPVEWLWAVLKPKVSHDQPFSHEQIRDSFLEHAAQVPQSSINKQVSAFKPRLRTCVQNNGAQLGNWRKSPQVLRERA